MAQQDNNEMNPMLEAVTENLNNFIENLNCLRVTYGFSEGTLNQQLFNASKQYNEFVSEYNKSCDPERINLEVPPSKIKHYKKLDKAKRTAEKALSLIPPTYIVSMVSIFDSFFAGLIRCLYSLRPEKVLESNKELHFRDIYNFDSVREIRKMVIDDTIEDLLRKSHLDQINWLETAINTPLKKFDGWASFIELTERRNLFVHSDGVVSSQYIDICKKQGFDTKAVNIGSKLNVDKSYFDASYKLLYQMGIMLTQILLNKHYVDIYSHDTGERDKVIINNVYELIVEKHYDVAIIVSNFALENQFRHKAKDKSYILLNLAQSYKWSGTNDKCIEVLNELDTSTWNDDLLIPKLVLEDQFEEVYKKMQNVGPHSMVLNMASYRDWPIFQKIREEERFQVLFKEIFGEALIVKQSIMVEEKPFEDNDTTTITTQ